MMNNDGTGEWIDVKIPFSELIPVMRTMTIPVGQRQPFKGTHYSYY